MRENYQNLDSYAFLHGFINGVRINPTTQTDEAGKVKQAVNLQVSTYHKDGNRDEYTNHNAVIFTSDEAVVAKFADIQAKLDENKARKDDAEYKRAVFPVEIEGSVMGKKGSKELSVVTSDKNVNLKPDMLAKGVPASVIVLSGNIADVKILNEENKFARVTIGHNYRGNDRESFFADFVVDGKIPAGNGLDQARLFEDLKSGAVAKGDFVRINGRMENNRFEVKQGPNVGQKVFGTQTTVYGFKKIERKEAKTQAPEAANTAPAVVDEKPKKVSRKGGVKK